MAKVVLLCVEIRLSTIGRREGKGHVDLPGEPPSGLDSIAAQRAELARAVEAIEQQVTSRLKIEREIAAEEAKKAQLSELESKIDQVAHLQRELHERDNKLAEAQKAQAESSRKQRELEDAKRQLDLQIETRVQELRSEAKQEAEDALKLNIKDKEEQIASMQRKLQDLDHMCEYLTGSRFVGC